MKKSLIKFSALILAVVMISSLGTACNSAGSGDGAGNNSPAQPSTPAAPTTPPSGEYTGPVMKVKVATMCPLSGESARMGVTVEAAIKAAEQHMAEDEYLNPAYEIEFIRPLIDDENATEKAVTAANLAISLDPHIVIGHHLTTMVIASTPLFEEAKIPVIGIISGFGAVDAAIEEGWEWFYMGTVTEKDSSFTLAEFLYEVKGLRNFLFLARNNESGMPSAESLMDNLEALGANIDRNKQYMLHDINDIDFTAQAMRAKELGVDCIATYAMSANQALVLYDQVEQIYGPVPETCFLSGGTAWGQPQMAELFPGEKLQGLVFPTGYIMDPDDEFKERFRQQFKENDPESQWPGDNQARIYDACWNIATAINMMVEAEGYLDPSDIVVFRERLNYYFSQIDRQGVQGHIQYNEFTDGRMIKNANVGEWQSDGTAIKIYPK